VNDQAPRPPSHAAGETAASPEERLRESEKRFRQFAENSGSVLWIADVASLRLEYLSPAFERLAGEPRDAMMQDVRRWNAFVHPEDRERVIAGVVRILEGETYLQEYRIVRPADGEVRWIRGTGFPMPDDDGTLRRVGGIAQDITEAKRVEERERRLWGELQLRVRNILAEVRSIAARTAETNQDPDEFFIHFDGRLSALARTHNMLTRGAEAAADLEELIRDEFLAAAVDDDRIEVAGPPVRLKDRAAEVMALAIHELATNAVKFGALAVHSGRVSVQWRVTERSGKGLLAVEWRESGVPALDHAPRRNGFGRGLIERGLAYELGARTSLQFVGGGLLATMELPLDGGKVVLDADVGEPT
jgi:PAS domain S-box-containing protein